MQNDYETGLLAEIENQAETWLASTCYSNIAGKIVTDDTDSIVQYIGILNEVNINSQQPFFPYIETHRSKYPNLFSFLQSLTNYCSKP